MIIKSSLTFKTNKRHVFEKFEELKIAVRFIDTMMFAISIGIRNNASEALIGEDDVSIPFNTLHNADKHLTFLFKSAILTCDVPSVALTARDRILLAFHEDHDVPGFSKVQFLLSFMPYGLRELDNILESTAQATLDNLYDFVKDATSHGNLTDQDYDEIAKIQE
jgi:hypothetical protein